MLEFKEIELSDAEWIKQILKKSDFNGSEYSFGNNFVWRKVYNTRICRYKDFYIIHTHFRKPSFVFPAGEGDLCDVIGQMRAFALANGFPLFIHSINAQSMQKLEALFAGEFESGTVRDDYDYVYNTSDLITLQGKKYHSKRNHINRFMEQNWRFEPITEQNIAECVTMSEEWCRLNHCFDDTGAKHEFCAVRQSLQHYFKLGYSGGLIRLDGKVIAFTMGEPLNSNTFIVHIEKAYGDIQGAYPMINREFAEYAARDYAYINREDDAGEEGLRKAKLSYKPAFLVDKYWVQFHD